MSEVLVERKRTGWDVAIGALLLLGGIVVLVYATAATLVSILFIGWMLVAFGVLGIVAALFRIGRSGFWSAALGGGLLTVLGIFVLTHTDATALTLTLLAGVVFLVSGVMRIAESFQEPEYRVALLFGGIISAALGLIVLFNLFQASLVLLGVLLAVQMMVEGLVMMLIGRWHTMVTPAPPGPMTAAR
jgi:uncharacterized membrane protein HdeD (DUF308 family)